MSNPLVVSLVPGDDWSEVLTVLQANGQPANYAGWTIIAADITWSNGSIELAVDTSQAATGLFGIVAANDITGALPYGPVSTMLLKGLSPVGKVETIYYAKVDGVHVKAINTLTVAHVGTQGPRGKSLEIVEATADLVGGFGFDGDTAIIRPTGAMWQKAAGAWANAGKNFWGTLLQQGADQVELARRWAEEDPDVDVDNGFSARHWASRAEYWATRPAVLTIAGSITGLDAIAANLPAVLDASNQAAAAATSAANALTYSLSASAYNDQARTYQLLAASYASNAGTVFTQLSVLLASLSDSGLSGAVLGAAKRIVAATDVTAVFVYDTAKDSDGGVWRWRARGTWFYEALSTATRGSRQFFPKRALIIARNVNAGALTIYDLDDSTCPMWMVFNTQAGTAPNLNFLASTTTVTSVFMMNGILYVGRNGDAYHNIDFILDRARQPYTSGIYEWLGVGISSRNSLPTRTAISTTPSLINNTVSTITGSVLPGTPIDPARRLPTPTLAIQTPGGETNVRYDGSIQNVGTANAQGVGVFSPNGKLWVNGVVGSNYLDWLYVPQSGQNLGSNGTFFRDANTAYVAQPRAWCGNNQIAGGHVNRGGIARVLLSETAYSTTSALAYINTTYNSGFIPGTGLLALSDSTIDTTSIVQGGTNYLPAASPELFSDAVAQASIGAQTNATYSAGTYTVFRDGIANGQITIGNVVAGKTYRISGNQDIGGGGAAHVRRFVVGVTQIATSPTITGPGSFSEDFVANSTGVMAMNGGPNSGYSWSGGNFSLKELTVATFFDDFSTYADTAALLAAYPASTVGGVGTITLNAGRAALDRPGSGDAAVLRRSFTTNVGTRYLITVDDTGGLATIRAGTTNNGSELIANLSLVAGTNVFSFVATTTTSWIQFNAVTIGSTVFIDNFRLDVAATDRSAGTANNPRVIGSLNRGAVATGAELAYITPANASSGAEMDSASLTAIGTGDFSFTMLVRGNPGGSTTPIVDMRNTADTASAFAITRVTSSGSGALNVILNGSTAVGVTAFTDTVWRHVVIGRRAGVLETWINGVREATAAAASSLVSGQATLHLLKNYLSNNSAAGMAFANIRISPYMPTPAQIRFMAPAELLMCQPGAKCLLTGSNTVQALSYDDGTGLLYVANAVNGTDVFNGLVRQSTMNMASENVLGAELVTNGNFAGGSTGWGLGTGWSVAGGVATHDGSGVGVLSQNISLTAGKTYLVTWSVTGYATGSGVMTALFFGGATASGGATSGNGSFAKLITANTGNTSLRFNTDNGSYVGSVTNVSVREVTTLRLGSDNHKGVSATNDNIAIFTDADVYMKTPTISLREAMDTAIGRPADTPVYDRNVVARPPSGITTNATATVIGRIPMDKGEAGDWTIRTMAKESGEPASPEFADFEDKVSAYRPGEGNVVIAASVQRVINRSTVTITVSIVANTSLNTLDITVVGVNPKNLEWGYEARFASSVQQVAA